ncbi:MAG: site-2 protease family protein [Candidatus Micrarchaeota archaeon]
MENKDSAQKEENAGKKRSGAGKKGDAEGSAGKTGNAREKIAGKEVDKGKENAGKGEGIIIPDFTEGLRNGVKKVRPKNERVRWAVFIAIVAITIFLFATLLSTDFSAMAKAIGSAIIFLISGEVMRALMDWEGFWGLILFKDRKALGWIDRQAGKYKEVWIAIADIGLVLGYGLFSWFLIGKEQRKGKNLLLMYGMGMPLLLLFSIFAAPMALPVISAMISGGDFQTASIHMKDSLEGVGTLDFEINGENVEFSIFGIAMLVVLVLGGLATSVLLSLVVYAIVILPPLAAKIISIIVALVTGQEFSVDDVPPPGGAPILPGINLPFVEGILALASLLIVHEMSHALLARVSKVKLDSAGVVFFGILPFGAFVDPVEKDMEKIEGYEVNRIIVAGSAANFALAIVSFFLLTAFFWGTQDLRMEGWKVVSGNLPKGAIVYSMDGIGYKGQNITLPANSKIVVNTHLGEFEKDTDEEGKIGIKMVKVHKSGAGFAYQFKKGWEWMDFIINTLGLMFATNMLVGIVNLLPIPLFDGQRLMLNGVKNKKIALAITVLASGAFLVNLLPWIFK